MTARKEVQSYIFVPIGEYSQRALYSGLIEVRGEILAGEPRNFRTRHGEELTGVMQSVDQSRQIISHIKATPELSIDVYKLLAGNEFVTPVMVQRTRAEKDFDLLGKVTRGVPGQTLAEA